MSQTNRTNPAYAYLAYRRAIIQHITVLLTREYCAPPNSEPEEKIYSDEVFRCDAEVPVTDIVRYIEELQLEDANLQLEMNKFDFRAKEVPPISVPPVQASKDAVNEQSKDQADGGGTQSARRRRPLSKSPS